MTTATLAARLDAVSAPVLVKADGARMRLFKAPADGEPQVPASASTVVPVAGVRVVGRPLSEAHVHRVDRVVGLTNRTPGDTLRPADVATVLASDRGGRKGVPDDATVIPLPNTVDDAGREQVARDVATPGRTCPASS